MSVCVLAIRTNCVSYSPHQRVKLTTCVCVRRWHVNLEEAITKKFRRSVVKSSQWWSTGVFGSESRFKSNSRCRRCHVKRRSTTAGFHRPESRKLCNRTTKWAKWPPLFRSSSVSFIVVAFDKVSFFFNWFFSSISACSRNIRRKSSQKFV